MSVLLPCNAQNPWRVVHWRLIRATSIVDGTGPSTTVKRDGTSASVRWIKQAVKFLKAFERCEDDNQVARLAQEQPSIFRAHELWQNSDLPDRRVIEALILAGESNEAIARHTGQLPETIEAYEALFFNVREKLAHSDYIRWVAMRPNVNGFFRGGTDFLSGFVDGSE
jgi:hypothetical protein